MIERGRARPPDFDDLTDEEARGIDQVCDGFETILKSGRRPRIEDFLEGCDGSARLVLLHELVLLEADYRSQAGEDFEPDDYRRRFSEFRDGWLDRAAGDAGRKQHVRESDSFLEHLPADPRSEDIPAEANRRRRLGKFQLLEKVAEGAFGTVWRALDVQLKRTVALKIPQAHLIESRDEVERFYTEARVVAQLRHPGIVTLHEVLIVDDLPILVSDFVSGISLRDLSARWRLSPSEAAELVAKVADALAYAHSMGAIHRDLKPANIMVDLTQAGADGASEEADCGLPGEPRIVDFGLAFLKQDDAKLAGQEGIIGTPAYMSPEQAIGPSGDNSVDHRTDIYSLGVVLFELLTETLPLSGTRSQILNDLIHGDPPSPRSRDQKISRDLDSICLKAMAREPDRRYASARELADDLRNFLQGEPVRARPISRWQRFLRHAQRRPAETALGLLGIVTLLAMIGLGAGYRYQRRLENLVQETGLQKDRAESFLYFHRMALAQREWSANNIDSVDRLLEDCPQRLRGWEWRYLKRQCHHDLFSIFHSRSSRQALSVTHIRFGPDGKTFATACKDGTVRLWDAATRDELRLLGGSSNDGIYCLDYDPGGKRLATGGLDGTVRIWDIETGALLQALPRGAETIYALRYAPDGRILASGSGFPPWEFVESMRGKGVIRLWNSAGGKLVRTLRGHFQNVMGVAFSPDGKTLASVSGSWVNVPQVASRPGELILWSTETGEIRRKSTGHGGPLTGVAYRPDGALIATSSWDRTVKVWDAGTLVLLQSLAGHQDWVLNVAFSPDGGRIASTGADGAIKVWEVGGGREPYTLRGHTQPVTCVAFSPDGRRLGSTSSDQTIKFWDAASNPEAITWRGAGGPIARISYFPGGRQLMVAGNTEDESGRVHPRLNILDVAGELPAGTLACSGAGGEDRTIDAIAIRPDGAMVAAVSQFGGLEAWTVPDGRSCFRFEEPANRFHAVAFSPDCRMLAVAGQIEALSPTGEIVPSDNEDKGIVVVLDLYSGKTLWRREKMPTSIIRDIAFSPDGAILASADNATTVTLFDARTGDVQRSLSGHRRLVSHLAFSADGRRLASSSWDTTVIVWDMLTWRRLATLQGHKRSVLCVAISPDGSRLATSSEDGTVKLWDLQTGMEVLTLRGHTEIVPSVAFSPDGTQLATAGVDGTVQIHQAGPPGLAGGDRGR
jgi:WD40 repeat protein/tRNA A-37 threonylcarbamoyl transferase component Bud32